MNYHHHLTVTISLIVVADRIVSVAGEGTFGLVFNCIDKKYDALVAVKAVRSVPRYLDAAEVEIEILERINREDPHDKSYYSDFDSVHDQGYDITTIVSVVVVCAC